jgi:alpha-L-rhamnosidase
MFGSVDEWFYKTLLGIKPTAPGFKQMVIKPMPAQLSWAKGAYSSVRGLIKSEWKKSAGFFELKVSVPVNTSAEIWLPALTASAITESGKAVTGNGDVHFIKYENGYAVFMVGNGDYVFAAKDE